MPRPHRLVHEFSSATLQYSKRASGRNDESEAEFILETGQVPVCTRPNSLGKAKSYLQFECWEVPENASALASQGHCQSRLGDQWGVTVWLFVSDADETVLPEESELEEIDARENPLSDSSHEFIKRIRTVTIHVSPPEEHEWDDL